jgi:hypothetical protein
MINTRACFVAKVVGGGIKKQESEIEDIKLFNLNAVPATLSFKQGV